MKWIIHKHMLQPSTLLHLAKSATILSAQAQGEYIYLWEMHDPSDDSREKRAFIIKPTGEEFDDPKVGVCGFGGAFQLGENDVYRVPYKLEHLARVHYMSNQTDAETHGERFTGECNVATLDGFALIVRRELLDRWRPSGAG